MEDCDERKLPQVTVCWTAGEDGEKASVAKAVNAAGDAGCGEAKETMKGRMLPEVDVRENTLEGRMLPRAVASEKTSGGEHCPEMAVYTKIIEGRRLRGRKGRRKPHATICEGTANGQWVPQGIMCEKAVTRRRLLQDHM